MTKVSKKAVCILQAWCEGLDGSEAPGVLELQDERSSGPRNTQGIKPYLWQQLVSSERKVNLY